MLPQPQLPARSTKTHGRPADPPIWYSSIPRRLLTDLHDTPLAIGLYALVARLYVIVRAPVPLSRADVLRYDPTLKPGAVKRAFDRLVAGGWLAQAEQTGRQKHAYIPTWGRIKGAPLPWDLTDVCHGRPRHVQRLMLDRNLFDICMGKLATHATLSATVTRYITAPALSLVDIGSYALTQADIPCPTPALRCLGLIHNDQARPLPSEQRLLAIISQQTLALDADRIAPHATELTLGGTRRIGLAPQTLPNPHDGTAESQSTEGQPLFFVPPSLIGNLIGSLIGAQIGDEDKNVSRSTASESPKMRFSEHSQPITWESLDLAKKGIPPPTPSTHTVPGGGEVKPANQEGLPRRRSRRRGRPGLAIPDTESTQLLQSINVLPEQLIELAQIPVETVRTAIADGKARPGIRDLAGWVVTLLRAHRDHGWKIASPQPPAESPEVLGQAFAHYAAEQEAARHSGMPDDQPWFPPPEPELLHSSSAPIRLWNQVQSALKTQLSRNEFNTWIRRAILIGVEQGIATIMVPTALAQQVLTERYGPMLRDLLRMYTGEALDLRVILNPSAVDHPTSPAAVQPEEPSGSTPAQPSPDMRPNWITAERWAMLPIMLRAALAGSELVDGEVCGRTSYLSMLLSGRYRKEVETLMLTMSS